MPKSRVFEILDGGLEGPPVLSSPLVTTTVSQMEHTGAFYPRAHKEPLLMARLAEAIHLCFGFEGIRVPFDLCVEAEALGCEVRMGGDPPAPYLARSLDADPAPFPIKPDLFDQGRFPVVFHALRELRERYGDRIPLYAGVTGPFTLGGYLFETERVLRLPFRDPARLEILLDWLAELSSEYARRLLACGADVILLIDPNASGSMISPKLFERFLLPLYRRLCHNIKGRLLLHICGDTRGILRLIAKTGFAGFSFEGPSVSVGEARELLGGTMALVGNIPTTDVLLFGDPGQVKEEVRRALREGIHLLAPACAIPPRTPPENLQAMKEAWEEYL